MKKAFIMFTSLILVLALLLALGSQEAYAAEYGEYPVIAEVFHQQIECEHDFVGEVTKAATCKRTGVKTFTCQKCADTYTVTIAKSSHTYRTIRVLKAGCTSTGCCWNICTGCGDSYWQMTKATGHCFTEKVIKEATCTQNGRKWEICTNCGYAVRYTIPAAHTFKKGGTAKPTCTTDGYTTYYCTACKDTYQDDYVAKLGHNYTESIKVEPTCGYSGEKLYTCDRCGAQRTEYMPIDPNNHSYKLVNHEEPSCEKTGATIYECELCKEPAITEVPALGHDYVSTVVAPTCMEDGYTIHTCSRCTASFVDGENAALGHEYSVKEAKEATCTEDGFKTFVCAACADAFSEVIAAAGHAYDMTITAPTCENGGYTTYTCSACGDTYVDGQVDAKGHHYTEEIAEEPTCTEDGIKILTCETCGDVYTEAIPSGGHNYLCTVVPPNCVDDGYTIYTCDTCCDSYLNSEVAATGHAWSEWVITKEADEDIEGLRERTCGNCGEKETEVIDPIHYHNFVVTSQTEATCTEDGVIYRACSCGETNYSTVEEAKGHKWEKHHEDGVKHTNVYYVCHCGWRYLLGVAEDYPIYGDDAYDYDGFFAAYSEHLDAMGDERYEGHSYYSDSETIVEVPDKDWYECSACGAKK